MFLVFFIALLVTLNYYGLFFSLSGKIAPKVSLRENRAQSQSEDAGVY